ncbi:MAG: TonB-dependent receptor plug domain-containing protein, partial [Muribaculaceae bacterium]|nr:TonB-dependent receptor plug domain-containing protein [Muribaculaceae bacterium]
ADAELPLNRRVTIKAENKPISYILKEALPGTSIKVQNRKILLSVSASDNKDKKDTETGTETGKNSDKGYNLSGMVVDEKGEPLIGATVMQKGSNNGASTDIDGKFTIRVASANPVLIARYVGYNPAEIKTQKGAPVRIVLKSSSVDLNEVVVTALGITREQKSLGYAVTKVGGDDLNNTVSGNWLNALDGKVAGLSATGAGTGPNGSMRIILRGDQSLNYGSNEALFVVDGVPISSGDAGTGSGGTYSNADSPVDFGNGASEINPEDVESVSVLKGPAATALYGSRAANGAIVITTKSGKKTKGIGVTLNSSVTFERAGYFPDFQKEYGPGNDNGFSEFGFWQFNKTEAPEGFNATAYGSRYSFGEKYDPNKLRNQ